jgi:hypothetical protein
VSARPGSIPLAVRSPYLNTWQPGASLAGTWSRFWNGRVTAICGIARVDGVPHLFAGAPGDLVPAVMTQVGAELTATRSVFVLEAAGVRLTVSFFSPLDPDHLRRQCVPLSYITVQAASVDGADHAVGVHLDISAEWAHGDSGMPVTWQRHRTAGGNLALTFTPVGQTVLGETGDQASWGTVVLATAQAPGLSWELGPDTVVRGRSAFRDGLANTVDPARPRLISEAWPVAGLHLDLGTVGAAGPSAPFVVALGHVRDPAVSYLGTDLAAWWTTLWRGWEDMLDWFLADYPAALTTAVALDDAVAAAARAAVRDVGIGADVGTADEAADSACQDHAKVYALALRRAIGNTEIVARNGAPWVFVKDISAGGRVSPLDAICAAAPTFLPLSPNYLRLMLEPFFAAAAQGGSSGAAAAPAPSELGAHYPHAVGGSEPRDELPAEGTARLLMMTASMLRRLPRSAAAFFVRTHYAVLRAWGAYLMTHAHDADPAGPCLSGIAAAMDVIASFAGEPANQACSSVSIPNPEASHMVTYSSRFPSRFLPC